MQESSTNPSVREQITVTEVCTCCNPKLLFSHRASKGKRGNLAAVLALREEGDRVILTNASTNALLKAQEAFQGVAEELGIKNEQDIIKLVKEIRAERGEQYKCELC